MKILKYEIITWLKTQATVTNLVSDRIYPRRLEIERGLPAIAITKAAEVRYGVHSGEGGSVTTKLVFTIVAQSDREVELVKEKLLALLVEQVIDLGNVEADFSLESDSDLEDDSLLENDEFAGVLEFNVNWQL
jgi:hypothetical protein